MAKKPSGKVKMTASKRGSATFDNEVYPSMLEAIARRYPELSPTDAIARAVHMHQQRPGVCPISGAGYPVLGGDLRDSPGALGRSLIVPAAAVESAATPGPSEMKASEYMFQSFPG